MIDINRRLAARAAHEGKCDPQSRPLVLKELLDAVRVENVSTGKLNGRLLSQLARVANRANLSEALGLNSGHVLLSFFYESFLYAVAIEHYLELSYCNLVLFLLSSECSSIE